ncbi:CRISPR-associated protein, Cse4 family [Coriobacterium glomerans PW2]|uniref:CRISPR-associated protein, Cse4 family n=1 Tax=Coriobacterium glomerans (strain ATCC 49209 / DSM 20642 / JCM 10262 / PW2) TaxID=700015 RepID=F2NAL4_CORGP|nr:type I-E CRISPR-associated protein Cas7/Cse4/CasC [Coriobacterium glomerans]AEB06541.1 CRISPR-associated protein, Cse4 family [Coriobacterium glomerans PW2]
MFVDICVIQNVPSNNINRDDTGSPKTALYGGARRARVSSQAWKRAMRKMFPAYLPKGSLGVRTKYAVRLIKDRIVAACPDLESEGQELAEAALKALGLKLKKSRRAGSDSGEQETGYLLFLAPPEIDGLAQLMIDWHNTKRNINKLTKSMKKEAAAVFQDLRAIDIALFGRMLTEASKLNTDASAQVAHAISVDRVVQEYDYFAAVDDCASADNTGASMLETAGYNSSTLYRYATVNLDSLFEQLQDIEGTAKGTAVFVETFVRSMPTGKQNTFANRTLPSTVSVAFRSRQPINPVSAFEIPVSAKEDRSISQQAAELLEKRVAEIEGLFDEPADRAWCATIDLPATPNGALGERIDFKTLLGEVQREAERVLRTRS